MSPRGAPSEEVIDIDSSPFPHWRTPVAGSNSGCAAVQRLHGWKRGRVTGGGNLVQEGPCMVLETVLGMYASRVTPEQTIWVDDLIRQFRELVVLHRSYLQQDQILSGAQWRS